MVKLTKEQILEAITGSGGNISNIAKRLKTSWHTTKRHIEKYEETLQALDNELNIMLDVAESQLHEKVRAGDWSAIKFILSTKGKSRGYVERTQIQQTAQVKVIIED